MPLRDGETGKVFSEREAYTRAITDRLYQIEQHGTKEEKLARAIALVNLQFEFHRISTVFDKENRLLRAAGKKPREEASLRPEFVRAIHKVQDELANHQLVSVRMIGKKEIERFDRMLEGIQEYYAKDVQKEPPAQQQQRAEPGRQRSR